MLVSPQYSSLRATEHLTSLESNHCAILSRKRYINPVFSSHCAKREEGDGLDGRITVNLERLAANRSSRSMPIARTPPSHRGHASAAQTWECRVQSGASEMRQSLPVVTRDTAARRDSTESDSLSRIAVAPATSLRAAHRPVNCSRRPASRTRTSGIPKSAVDIP